MGCRLNIYEGEIIKNHLKNSNSKRISTVFFNSKDIERHEAVKEVLEIYGDV